MRIRWVRFGVLLVSGALLLGACGGGGGGEGDGGGEGSSAPAGVAVSVSGKEFAFEPATLTAPAGQQVTVSFQNVGTIEHDFSIDEADLSLIAQPGATVTGSFTLEAGTYTFYCNVPGHKEAGMTGTLTVS